MSSIATAHLALRTLILVAAFSFLQGCSSFRGAPAWDPAQTLESTDKLYDAALVRFFGTAVPAERVAVRDEYIARRMAQIDRNYGDYKQDLYSQRVGSAVGMDVATLALTGAAAAVSDVGTKTGASAVAALITGSKTSVDKNVYFDRTLPAMLSQMDGLRSVVRARLFAGLLLPGDRYSISQADSDLTEYRNAGTIYGAISAITAQAAQAQVAADKVIRDRLPAESEIRDTLTQKGFIVEQAAATDSAKRLAKCVHDDGTVDPSVSAPLKKWLSVAVPAWRKKFPGTLPLSPVPDSDFWSIDAYEPLRRQALADPTLGPLLAACK